MGPGNLMRVEPAAGVIKVLNDSRRISTAVYYFEQGGRDPGS